MSINNEIKFVKSFKRTTAVSIDIAIVLFIRIFVAQILGILWINKVIADFLLEFQAHFGTEFIKSEPSHIEFITHHKAFTSIIIFYILILMVGAIYHAYLNSSQWQATVGKRVMNIVMIGEDGKKISFMSAILHYFLSLLPFVYIFYLAAFQGINHITFFDAMTASAFNIFLAIIFALWVQAHIFTKKKTTLYDLICKVIFIEGKTSSKFPWKNV